MKTPVTLATDGGKAPQCQFPKQKNNGSVKYNILIDIEETSGHFKAEVPYLMLLAVSEIISTGQSIVCDGMA